MTIRYNIRGQTQVPIYLCQRDHVNSGGPICQRVPGAGIDAAVGALLVDLVSPTTLEVALRVQDELRVRAEEARMWLAQMVQRAREEADLARVRYMGADPHNRMVVDVLEAEWNVRPPGRSADRQSGSALHVTRQSAQYQRATRIPAGNLRPYVP